MAAPKSSHALRAAARRGDITTMRTLLEHGIEVDDRDLVRKAVVCCLGLADPLSAVARPVCDRTITHPFTGQPRKAMWRQCGCCWSTGRR